MTKKQNTLGLGILSAQKLAHIVNKDKLGKGSHCLSLSKTLHDQAMKEGLDIFVADSESWGPCDFCSDGNDKKVTIVRGELGMRQVRFCKKCMGELAEYFNGYL